MGVLNGTSAVSLCYVPPDTLEGVLTSSTG
jgi:hypothetical protein